MIFKVFWGFMEKLATLYTHLDDLVGKALPTGLGEKVEDCIKGYQAVLSKEEVCFHIYMAKKKLKQK